MTHETVHLVHRNDAGLVINEAVTPDGTQHLSVGQGLQDGIAFQLMKAEDARLNALPVATGEIDIGRAVEKLGPRSRSST